MEKHVDFDRYIEFVDAVTSDASKEFLALSERLVELDAKGANIERLLTAGVGINAEGGEFLEIVKKWYSKVNLGITIIESILLLSWVTLCGM